jgi:hypothetical protein
MWRTICTHETGLRSICARAPSGGWIAVGLELVRG